VTTHPRARALQAGAFLAVIGGILVIAPTPAHAVRPTVEVSRPANANLQAGQETTVSFKITNNNDDAADVQIAVSSTIQELTCAGDKCNFTIEQLASGASQSFTARMVAGQMQSGASKSGDIVVRATLENGESNTGSKEITVRGDNKAPTVREVSGKVVDDKGKAVSGAQVGLLDAARHNYETLTNGSGNFKFTSTDQQPISVGQIAVGAQLEGFTQKVVNVNGAAGATVRVEIAIKSTAAATPSPTPSVSATPSAEETVEPTEGAPTADTKIDPAPAANDAADEGSSSLIFIIVGGLLVAAGVGAIVLVLMRRKENDAANDADGEDDGTALGARSTATPPSQGRYGGVPDATRVANRGPDATMIAGAAIRPSLSDAPTMLQQAVPADEFPDPYGAPAAVPHAGYAAPGTSGWGAAPAAAAGTYGVTAAGAPGAYGAAAGAAAATSVYGAPAAPGAAYGVPAQASPPGNNYGAPAETYGAPPANQYGRPPAPGGAYGAGGAEPYGRPSSGAGYDGRPQSGAPQAAGPHDAVQQGSPYGAPDQRYDEPTGHYDPAAAQGYEQGGYQGGGYRPGDQGRGVPQDTSGPGGFRQQPVAGGYPAAEPDYPQAGRRQAAPDVPYQAGGGYQSGGGYAPAGGGYPAQPEQANPYGSWSPGAGIDSGNAYGAPAGNPGRGGYGAAPAQGGYDEPTGYDPRGTYGRQDGYDRAPEQQQGRGPQQSQGGYDDGGYYGGEQQQPPQGGGRHGGSQQEPRRPLDWLDD
jgi:hypothetical protein